jgi:hypothetical protein
MTELLHMALVCANALDPIEQDRIAMAMLAEPSIAEIRARLGEAGAEQFLEDCDALWEARFTPAEDIILF